MKINEKKNEKNEEIHKEITNNNKVNFYENEIEDFSIKTSEIEKKEKIEKIEKKEKSLEEIHKENFLTHNIIKFKESNKKKISEKNVNICFVGMVSSGKSSIINKLIDIQDYCPTDSGPMTAFFIKLKFSKNKIPLEKKIEIKKELKKLMKQEETNINIYIFTRIYSK
jgi:ribosome biogenesis GTPase A